MGYREDLAAYRQQKDAQEFQQRAQEIVNEYREYSAACDAAAQAGDDETFRAYDQCRRDLETEYQARYAPKPQADPRELEFLRRHKPFLDRHGQFGYNGLNEAYKYATRPKIPGERNPGITGMGFQKGSQAAFDATRDLMETYAKDYGLTYDKNETVLVPDEAAKISGLSNKEYNRGVYAMQAQGRIGKDD
jgi:hypothetical protein